MTTTHPAEVHSTDKPNTRGGAVERQPTRVLSRHGKETKPFYKTTEFVVFVLATIGVLLASYLVKTSDGHGDYFQADKAWLYVVILSVGYMLSRGLAKSGSRHHDDA